MLDTLAGVGRFILILFEVILIFNLMIVVHEYGHFLAARWRGLKIEKFQIWFGKAIIKKEINGVQWGLGTIPLGGFVALPQMAPMEAIEGKGDDERRCCRKFRRWTKSSWRLRDRCSVSGWRSSSPASSGAWASRRAPRAPAR